MTVPRQAVLFVGGRGERLMPLTAKTPKPMVRIHGRPFLEYLIEQLHDAGVKDVLLLAGYRGEQIASHFAATDGVRVAITPPQWETGRRLLDVAPLLDERFLLLYGDNFAPVSLPWLAERHAEAGKSLTVTVCEKQGGNVRLGGGKTVGVYTPGGWEKSTHSDIGYMVAERDHVLGMNTDGNFSHTLGQLVQEHQVDAFDPGCPYWSISDPERLKLTAEMLRPKKIILLDRDGVLNDKAPKGEYITRREDFRWIEEAGVVALSELGMHDFSFIVLTNQAAIGRGVCTRQAVDELHSWMSAKLYKEENVNILDVLVCPHHWDDNCRCRKPLPGMFFDAAKKHNIRLDRTIYVGDDERDQTAALRAGCRFLFAEDGWQDAALDTFKGWGIE